MLKSQAVEREYEESHWEVASPAPGPASGQMMENVEHLHHKPVEDWPANMDRSVFRGVMVIMLDTVREERWDYFRRECGHRNISSAEVAHCAMDSGQSAYVWEVANCDQLLVIGTESSMCNCQDCNCHFSLKIVRLYLRYHPSYSAKILNFLRMFLSNKYF